MYSGKQKITKMELGWCKLTNYEAEVILVLIDSYGISNPHRNHVVSDWRRKC
jgi:hypothetical protein